MGMPAMIPPDEVEARYKNILKVRDDLLSALDSRYLKEAKPLISYISPRALHAYDLLVLRAFTKTLMEMGHVPEKEGNEILSVAVPQKVPIEKQWEWEKKLNHDIRGLVAAVDENLSEAARKFNYKGPTSYDIIDTAFSLAYRDAALEVIIPASIKFMEAILAQAEKHKSTVMVGRTHRQHAVPTTFGHYLMEVLQGFGEELKEFALKAVNLPGKLSGICGNRDSYELLYGDDALEIEHATLARLRIKPDPITGQVVHQHSYSNYFHPLIQLGEYLSKFANDMRSFQQTEIGEVYEKVPDDDVGSSTAAQKVNPIRSENISGQQRQLRCRMQPVYEDSEIDGERDLRNSSSMRYYAELAGVYMNEVERGAEIAKNMWVRPEVMQENLQITSGQVVSEALQLYLGRNGIVVDAHEYVKKLARTCQTGNAQFVDVVKADPVWEKLSSQMKDFLAKPEMYLGTSVKDTQRMIDNWRAEIAEMKSVITEQAGFAYNV